MTVQHTGWASGLCRDNTPRSYIVGMVEHTVDDALPQEAKSGRDMGCRKHTFV